MKCHQKYQNIYGNSKQIPVTYFDGRRWLPCHHLFEKSTRDSPTALHPALKPKVPFTTGPVEKIHPDRSLITSPHTRSPEEIKQYADPRLMIPDWYHHSRYAQNAYGLPINPALGVSPSMMPFPSHMDSKLHNRRRPAQYGYPPATVPMAVPLAENLALYSRLTKPLGGGLYPTDVYNNNMMQSALFKTQLNAPSIVPTTTAPVSLPTTETKTSGSPFECDISV